MAADVAGYSRLMGRDEEGTLAQWMFAQRRGVISWTLSTCGVRSAICCTFTFAIRVGMRSMLARRHGTS
jgi:hypothetical protein